MLAGPILIIDDDEVLIDLVSQYLTKNGLPCVSANTPDEGITLVRENTPRLIVLDVMLPGKDGFQPAGKSARSAPFPSLCLPPVER